MIVGGCLSSSSLKFRSELERRDRAITLGILGEDPNRLNKELSLPDGYGS